MEENIIYQEGATISQRPLILSYLPWLEDSEIILLQLKAIGLTHRQITKLLIGETVTLSGEITDPYTARILSISEVSVRLAITNNGHKAEILVNNMDLCDYLKEWYSHETILGKEALDNPLICQLYEENLALKRQLAGKSRAYK